MDETPRHSPYQGLVPFDEQDAEFFFGREKETRQIIANMFAAPLTLLYGASGAGKSSVLRAGVVPKLRKRADLAVAVFSAWQNDPVRELKACLTQAVEKATGQPMPPADSSSLYTCVERFELSAHRVRLLMVILDQFEEYFLYPDPGDKFAEQFSELVHQPDLPVNFLISIREDSLARLNRFEGRIPTLFENHFRIEHLGEESLRQAIEKPLQRYNERYAPRIDIEPELIQAVLHPTQKEQDILRAAGDNAAVGKSEGLIATPYLQLVMSRVWKEEMTAGSTLLRSQTLRRLGGPEHMVRTHLDEALGGLSPRERAIAASAFRFLVTPSGSKIALSEQDLAKSIEVAEARVVPVLKSLSKPGTFILRKIEDAGGSKFEIFHDVLAMPIRDWQRRFAERMRLHRWLRVFAATTLVMLLFASLAVYAFWQKQRAERAQQITLARKLAAQVELQLNQNPNQLHLSTLLAIEALHRFYFVEGHSALLHALSLLPRSVAQMKHEARVVAIAYSPNGRYVATASSDRTAQVWNATNGVPIGARASHSNKVTDVVFSPDGLSFATASEDTTAQLWATVTGQRIGQPLKHDTFVEKVVFSPDGFYLATASSNLVRIWAVPSGQLIGLPARHGGVVTSIAFMPPDGKRYATASGGQVTFWETATGELYRPPLSHTRMVKDVAFSPDGKYFASAGVGGARLWETTTLAPIKGPATEAGVLKVVFSHNGKYLALTGGDGTVALWAMSGGTNVFLKHHKQAVVAASFSRNDRYLATASQDGTGRVWEIPGGVELARMPHEKPLTAIAFSPEGDHLATASDDSTARIWELAAPLETAMTNVDGPVVTAAFSPNGEYLATVRSDRTVRLRQRSLARDLTGFVYTGKVASIAFSKDSRYLLAGRRDGLVEMLELPGGRAVPLLTHSGNVNAVAFSPDQKQVATAVTNTVWIWDRATKRHVFPLPHDRTVKAVAYTPDGRYLVTSTWESNSLVRVWEIAGHRVIAHVKDDRDPSALAFNPAGNYLATGSDGKVRVWDWSKRQEIARFDAGDVKSIAFNSDGRYLTAISKDSISRVWPWHPDQLIAEACQRLTRNLTPEEWAEYLGAEPYRKTCPGLP